MLHLMKPPRDAPGGFLWRRCKIDVEASSRDALAVVSREMQGVRRSCQVGCDMSLIEYSFGGAVRSLEYEQLLAVEVRGTDKPNSHQLRSRRFEKEGGGDDHEHARQRDNPPFP